jgi:hypothetical protein
MSLAGVRSCILAGKGEKSDEKLVWIWYSPESCPPFQKRGKIPMLFIPRENTKVHGSQVF